MSGIGLDTEAPGFDWHHGCRPYIVTISNEEYENTFWEWDVNPIDRSVKVPKQDSEEIAHAILEAEFIAIQNAKFDIIGLNYILPEDFQWPYELVHDTTFAAHLIESNKPKDLTALAIDVLEVDIQQFETDVEKATNKCRNLVRKKNSPIGNWRIAKKGLPEMPSVNKEVWKADMWLPRQVLNWAIENERLDIIPDLTQEMIECGTPHPWFDVTSKYANTDSCSCLAIFLRQKKIIEQLGLWKLYECRRELIPCIVEMETHGVTMHGKQVAKVRPVFQAINDKAAAKCISIAKSYDYEIELPKGGKNNSLSNFVFDVMKLLPVKLGNQRKKKTDAPSLDKNVKAYYVQTLPERSKPLKFMEALQDKQATDTAIGFLDSYEKFWLPHFHPDVYVVHPSLNPTGTNTLRWTSSNPNEQQISKREDYNIRQVFGPAPGREWWSCDAQNIELRIPAYEAGEQEMIDLFEKPNDPPYYGSNHLLNFHAVYPDIWDKGVKEVGLEKVGRWCKEAQPQWHKRVKNGGFAVQYGAMDREDGMGTADIAFGRPGSHDLLKKRFARIHGPTGLNQQCIAHANKYGFVYTLPDKSVDPYHGYPLYCPRTQWGGVLPTVPLNYHIQGTACWWMCKAMIRCRKLLLEWAEEGFFAYMVMQVHDELVFDLPAGKGLRPYRTNLKRIRALVELMKQGGDDIGIPTAVNCEYHSENWGTGIPIYLSKEN